MGKKREGGKGRGGRGGEGWEGAAGLPPKLKFGPQNYFPCVGAALTRTHHHL